MSDRASIPPSDLPITEPGADRLGRGEIAARLYRLLTTAPAEWPVRVALFGAWGEGKTSVANLVTASAVRDRHVVVTYPVSSIASVEDLWLGFCRAFSDSIGKAKLLQPHELPYRQLDAAAAALRSGGTITSVGEVAAAGIDSYFGIPSLSGIVKGATSLGVSALRHALGVDAATVKKIHKKLGPDRRVIVLLDDLDRADPRVVPELLLRLRDLLELPQFSFLVPFDRDVVARTLQQHHPAWENPDRFLEKIFDYQIDLPEPSPSARLRMIEGEIERHCSFIPLNLVDRLRDVLPSSPRKLKSLIRHLYLYREEAARHDEGEIDWWTVLCFEVLRQVSARHRDVAIEALTRWPEHQRNNRRGLSVQEAALKLSTHNDLQAFIFHAFDKAETTIITSQGAHETIAAWLKWPQKSREKTALSDIRLLEISSLISTGEYREQFEKWREERRREPLLAWIDERASVKAASSAETCAGFLCRALEWRGGLVDFMHQRRFKDELAAPAGEAAVILDLVGELLPEIGDETGFRDDLDRAVIEQVGQRFHFDGNDADRRLRDHEMMVLERLVEKDHGRAELLLSLLGTTWPNPDARERWRALQERLSAAVRPLLAQRLWRRFQVDQARQPLVATDASLAIKGLALGDDTPLWRRDDPLSLWPLLEQEEVSPQVAGNALDLLGTCVALLAYLDGSQDLARAFLAREKQVAALWKAAMSHEWQFSHLHYCRELRLRLIDEHHALKRVLPEPTWLREGEPEAAS